MQIDKHQNQHVNTNLQQIKAINRLLDLDQKKTLGDEHWHLGDRINHHSAQIHQKSSPKIQEKKSFRLSDKSQSLQKDLELKRLKQLIKEASEQEQQKIENKQQQAISQDNQEINLKFTGNAKLRPFNSNMTFYHTRKEQKPKQKVLSSSLTFYRNSSKLDSIPQNQVQNKWRLFKQQQAGYLQQFLRTNKSNNIVYFKPNKSQTIRELLNQMRIERSKNNQIILNSTNRRYQINNEEQINQIKYLNQHEIKELTKYKNFIPFRENQNLLLKKISDGENIWKKKFKQSWLRKKNEVEGKRNSYFKRLIVTD